MSYEIDQEVRIVGPRNVGRDGYPDGYDLGVTAKVVKSPVNAMWQVRAEGLRPYWIAEEHLEAAAPATPAEPAETTPAVEPETTPEGN